MSEETGKIKLTIKEQVADLVNTGVISLVNTGPSITEFHLPGKHDQENHGHPGPGEPAQGATVKRAPREGSKAAIAAQHKAEIAAQRKEFHANIEKDLEEKFGKGTVQRIRDAGHDPADYYKDKVDPKTKAPTGEYQVSGKPFPGTDSWRDAHGISKEAWDARPMKRYTGSDDPVVSDLYEGATDQNKRFAKHTVARQSDGIIMVRKPYPGAEKDGFGYITPQIRPDNPVIVDGRERSKKETKVEISKQYAEKVNGWSEQDLIADRQAKVNRAKKDLRKIETARFLDSPSDVDRPYRQAEDKARASLKNAIKESGDPKVQKAFSEFEKAKKRGDPEVKAAQDRLSKAKRNVKNGDYSEVRAADKALEEAKSKHGDIRKAETKLNKAIKDSGNEELSKKKHSYNKAADELKDASALKRLIRDDPEQAVGRAREAVSDAEDSLKHAKADPKKTLEAVREYANERAIKAEGSFDKTRIKYAFPPGEGSAKRIEVNADPQNIKNLTQGKDKVYFIMEGNIKADAALTAIKREDPKAAVVSVPSVTLWNEKEVEGLAKRHLQGRDIVLVPDADGAFNPDVEKQAKQLKGALKGQGVGEVFLAAPPVIFYRDQKDGRWKPGTDSIKYPTADPKSKKLIHDYPDKDADGFDGRKGLDDHLGLGKGTLGDLVFNDTPSPKFNIIKDRQEAGMKVPRPQTHATINSLHNAISDLGGQNGIARISKNALTKYTGLPEISVHANLKQLESMGAIKVHRIFDPVAQGKGIKRVLIRDIKEIRRITKAAGVGMPDLESKYFDKDERNEQSPIIEILDPKYHTKPGPAKRLASRFKNLRISGASRIVRTREGAALYGVPIGSPIPAGPLPDTVLSMRMLEDPSTGNRTGFIHLAKEE